MSQACSRSCGTGGMTGSGRGHAHRRTARGGERAATGAGDLDPRAGAPGREAVLVGRHPWWQPASPPWPPSTAVTTADGTGRAPAPRHPSCSSPARTPPVCSPSAVPWRASGTGSIPRASTSTPSCSSRTPPGGSPAPRRPDQGDRVGGRRVPGALGLRLAPRRPERQTTTRHRGPGPARPGHHQRPLTPPAPGPADPPRPPRPHPDPALHPLRSPTPPWTSGCARI